MNGAMFRSALLLGLGLACFGCSTLPNRYATPEDEESGIVDVKEYVGDGERPAGGGEAADGTTPGQQSVAWEDNGRPIRELTPDPRPEEYKLPGNDMKQQMRKKGVIPAPASSTSTLPQN